MAVDAAYFEPTIDVDTAPNRSSSEPQFGFQAWTTDDLTPLRRVSTQSNVTISMSSRGDSTMSDDLPSFTAVKRDVHMGAAVAGAPPTTSKYEDLAKQHGALAVKQFEGGGLTAAEQRQFRMLKWALDTIEMEQMEPSLKRLQGLVQMQRKLQKEVDRLVAVMR